jgi:integrase/recombinase XerD
MIRSKNTSPCAQPAAPDVKAIRHFLDAMVAMRGISPNTLAAYQRDLDAAAAVLAGRSGLVAATPDDLRHCLKCWSGYLASRSVLRRLSAVRSFMAFLVEENLRADNPAAHIDAPKTAKSLPKSLSEEDMGKLLSAAAADTSPQGVMLMSMLEMLYGAGLRISELIHLPVASFTRRHDHITIVGKGGKERVVMLTAAAHLATEAWLKIRDNVAGSVTSPYLYPSRNADRPISRGRVFGLIRQVGLRAELSTSVSPHILRHSFATHMLNRGADLRSLQMLLGHADISTTEIYTQTRDDRLAGLVRDAHPLARSTSCLDVQN